MNRRDKLRGARLAETRAEVLGAVRDSIRIAPTLSKMARKKRRNRANRIAKNRQSARKKTGHI